MHNYHFHILWRDNVPGIQWVSRSVPCAQLSFPCVVERQEGGVMDGLAKLMSCFVHFDCVMCLLVLVCPLLFCHLCQWCVCACVVTLLLVRVLPCCNVVSWVCDCCVVVLWAPCGIACHVYVCTFSFKCKARHTKIFHYCYCLFATAFLS